MDVDISNQANILDLMDIHNSPLISPSSFNSNSPSANNILIDLIDNNSSSSSDGEEMDECYEEKLDVNYDYLESGCNDDNELSNTNLDDLNDLEINFINEINNNVNETKNHNWDTNPNNMEWDQFGSWKSVSSTNTPFYQNKSTIFSKECKEAAQKDPLSLFMYFLPLSFWKTVADAMNKELKLLQDKHSKLCNANEIIKVSDVFKLIGCLLYMKLNKLQGKGMQRYWMTNEKNLKYKNWGFLQSPLPQIMNFRKFQLLCTLFRCSSIPL